MTILVEFEKAWHLNDIKNFITNPNDDKYKNLTNDEYLELVACGDCDYSGGYGDLVYDSDKNVNYCREGQDSVANSLESYFYQELFEDYLSHCVSCVENHLNFEALR